MALVSCPECGREDVSDTAEACPGCGYGIKAHFIAAKEREEQRRKGIEEKERISSVPLPDKPAYKVWTLIVGLVLLASTYPLINSQWNIVGIMTALIGLSLILGGISTFWDSLKSYRRIMADPDAYKRRIAVPIQYATRKKYKCPNCGARAGVPLSVGGKLVSSSFVGIASNKVGKSYKCESCGYIW